MRAACWVLCPPSAGGGAPGGRRAAAGTPEAAGSRSGWGGGRRAEATVGRAFGPVPQRRSAAPGGPGPRGRGPGAAGRALAAPWFTERSARRRRPRPKDGALGAQRGPPPRVRGGARAALTQSIPAALSGRPARGPPAARRRRDNKGRAGREGLCGGRGSGARGQFPRKPAPSGAGDAIPAALPRSGPPSPRQHPPLAHAGGGRGPAPAPPRAASPPARSAAFSFVSRSPERLLSRREGAGGGQPDGPLEEKVGEAGAPRPLQPQVAPAGCGGCCWLGN